LVHELLHKKIVAQSDEVKAWFRSKSQNLDFPFYSSFDIRDSQYKVVPVDANIFPAGFNNICNVDKESAVEIVEQFVDDHYGTSFKRVLVLTEEHTQNPYYWDNVWVIKEMLEGSGRQVKIAIPRALPAPIEVKSASGHTMTVESAQREGGGVKIGDFVPQLIICNNDFSNEYEEWSKGLTTPMNPPSSLGWYRRRKDKFFSEYNRLVGEFCQVIDMDPWHFQVQTEVFPAFDVEDENSRLALSEHSQKVYERIRGEYKDHGIKSEPFLFVKNNAGTYGLGVIQVAHPDEIKSWNYKSRKKMKAAKGGREVSEVIIQEGVPTVVQAEGGRTAEPCIYMVGCQLAGGFLRAHSEKGPEDSLNSPGAIYQKLCVSDLNVKMGDCPMENAYGWIARLGFLSIALEAKALNVEFRDYIRQGRDCSSPD
jgi:glutamate--cysteine ligase